MRLDKFLGLTGNVTRSQAKQFIKKGLVTVNGIKAESPEQKINEAQDTVALRGIPLAYNAFVGYLLYKPAGVITATEDRSQRTVLDLLDVPIKGLFPVGRLDKDTEGLLLITNDGALAHRLLSPGKHVDKTYQVGIKFPLSKEAAEKLKAGVDIGDDTPTLPAGLEICSDTEILLTIREGRYHQIKRMLAAVDNEVLSLKRLRMGPLSLPKDLAPGEFRPLSQDEIESLQMEGLL